MNPGYPIYNVPNKGSILLYIVFDSCWTLFHDTVFFAHRTCEVTKFLSSHLTMSDQTKFQKLKVMRFCINSLPDRRTQTRILNTIDMYEFNLQWVTLTVQLVEFAYKGSYVCANSIWVDRVPPHILLFASKTPNTLHRLIPTYKFIFTLGSRFYW